MGVHQGASDKHLPPASRSASGARRSAEGNEANPYLNTPPTKLRRMLQTAVGRERKLIAEALEAWRATHTWLDPYLRAKVAEDYIWTRGINPYTNVSANKLRRMLNNATGLKRTQIMQALHLQGATFRSPQERAAGYEDVGFGEQGYWGNAGSGMLFTTGDEILLLHRSSFVQEPNTWGIPGGAIPEDEDTGRLMDPLRSAVKEVREEVGQVPPHRVVDKYVFQDGGFRFTTFIAKVGKTFRPRLDWENSDYAWVSREDIDDYRLHFGVRRLLAHKDPWASGTKSAAAKTHYKLDPRAVRNATRRDPKREAEDSRNFGWYTYQKLSIVPLSRIEKTPVWHPGRIAKIREAIQKGIPLPPIVADPDRSGTYRITDGIHRTNASREAGFTHIPVIETVTVETPDLYVAPEPEKPVLRPGAWVRLRDPRGEGASSPWAVVLEYVGPRDWMGARRHRYALLGYRRGEPDLLGDFLDIRFDPSKAPPKAIREELEASPEWDMFGLDR